MCFGTEYSATCRRTLVVGDMTVSCKRTGISVNQGGTADKLYSSLTECLSVRGFLFSRDRCTVVTI